MIQMIGAWLHRYKFEHPWIYGGLLSFAFLYLILTIFLYIPDTQLTRAVGIVNLQDRTMALRHALYWESRVKLNPYVHVGQQVKYGFVVGVTQDHKLVISVPENETYVQYEYKFADMQVQNILAVSTIVKNYRNENARFDIYGDMIVAYIDGMPLNLYLIERGFASPDPNPPSNIVDSAFATHYWSLVTGKYTKS